MGVPYEFFPPERIREVRWGMHGTHDQPPGTWSDDGALMLALLDSLLSTGFQLDDQGARALRWLDAGAYTPGGRFDVGTTTLSALMRLRAGARPAEAGMTGEQDNGNGSLMRILPVALVGRDHPVELTVRRAMEASCLTHRHPRAQMVCAVYAAAAQFLLRGEEPERALEHGMSVVRREAEDSTIRELRELETFSQPGGSGYVVDTFWSAWNALTASDSYQETIERAIRFGYDTDTTAAVAGGLAGIYWGKQGIPLDWLSGMRGKDIVEPLVRRLVG
jgi:ADP-ribosylglycohydrolase